MGKSSQEGVGAKIVYTILAFLLSMLIFFFTLLVILQSTFLNKNFILNEINDTNYYTDLSSEITEGLINLGNASGIDESFFTGIVDEVTLRENVSSYIKGFYSGKDPSIDSAAFQSQLTTKLEQYIKDNNLKVSDEAQAGLETFIREACDIYINRIELPYLGLAAGYFHKLLNPVLYVTIAAGILILLIGIIIIATNRWKHRAYRYLSYSTIGAFLMTLAVPILVYVIDKLDKLALQSQALFNLYYTCVTSFLNSFFYAAVLLALLSALFIFLHSRNRKRAIRG